MAIFLRCFATLSKYQPEDGEALELLPGETVAELLDRLWIPPEQVHIVFVNGRKSPPETLLQDGDRVGLFPAVGGG